MRRPERSVPRHPVDVGYGTDRSETKKTSNLGFRERLRNMNKTRETAQDVPQRPVDVGTGTDRAGRREAHEVQWTSVMRRPERSGDRTHACLHGFRERLRNINKTRKPAQDGAHEVRWTSVMRRPERSGDFEPIRNVLVRKRLRLQKNKNRSFDRFLFFTSARRDSNPRPSPWQGDTPPLSHLRVSYELPAFPLGTLLLYTLATDLSTKN